MTIYGYVRVSTKEQNLDRQLKKMKDKGISERNIFKDEVSGATFNRTDYELMRNRVLAEGDLVYIDALDRLGRNYEQVISEWKYITRELKADIIILENETLFDSRKFKEMGDIGLLMEDQFLSLLSYVADQERKKIKQRQREGIDAAKAAGRHLGRPVVNLDTITKDQKRILQQNYLTWKNGDITAVSFMKMMELKRSSFYKVLREYEASQT